MREQTPDLTHDNMPASVGLVKAVRDELRADIRAVEHGLNSKIMGLDSKIMGLDSKIMRLDSKVMGLESKIMGFDSKFVGLESKIEAVNSKVEQVMVSVHRTQVLMEEQRGENRIVLDGIKALIDRQERLETDMGELRNTVNTLRV